MHFCYLWFDLSRRGRIMMMKDLTCCVIVVFSSTLFMQYHNIKSVFFFFIKTHFIQVVICSTSKAGVVNLLRLWHKWVLQNNGARPPSASSRPGLPLAHL